MELFLVLVSIIILIYYSIKLVKDYKKKPNDTAINILENSRHLRLILITIGAILCLIIFLIRCLFY